MKKRQLRNINQKDIKSESVSYKMSVPALDTAFDITFIREGLAAWRYVIAERQKALEPLSGENSYRWRKVKNGSSNHVGLQVARGILLNYLNS